MFQFANCFPYPVCEDSGRIWSYGLFEPPSSWTPAFMAAFMAVSFNQRERSAKPQLKNAISGQSYRFWDFTISFYSISWLHHLHPLANCVRKAFLHLHFSVWSMFDCPALSFAALQLYGMVWYLSMQLQITVAPSFLKLRNKFEFSCWKKSGWDLTATCSMPFIHPPASG